MTGYETLLKTASNPREHHVSLQCTACGEHAPVGLPDNEAGLPISCMFCGEELDDRSVLLANLQAARVEIAGLASAIGKILASVAVANEDHPHTVRKPRETLERTVDIVVGDSALPAMAALQSAVMRT